MPEPPDADPDSSSAVPLLFGRYRVERELGRGGMGRVLLAFDTKLRIHVAVKLVPEQLMADVEAAESLRAEVLRGMALNHDAIVRTHTFEQDASGAAIVMEYIHGLTLTEWKTQQPGKCFDCDALLPWLRPLCEVLDYAHREARIVHRDLKPQNIMVSQDGKLKVVDFGIAATLSDSVSRVTGQGGTSGTPAYMSPQQARGKRPSHLDDVYALGATIYDLIAGKPPFFRGGVDTILLQIVAEPAPSMTERREELAIEGRAPIPEHWEQSIAACLAKDPAERPQSCGEVLARLQGLVPATPAPLEPVEVVPPAPVPRPVVRVARPRPAPPRRRGSLVPTIAVLVMGIVLGTWWWVQRGKPAHVTAPELAKAAPLASTLRAEETPAPKPVLATPTPMLVASTTPKPATPAPATPAPAPPSEIEKWLAQVDAIYQPKYLAEVVKPYEDGLAELKKNTLATLEREITAASRAAKLNDAVVFRNERQRIESGQGVPAGDNDNPPPVLKTLRDIYRKLSAQFEADWRKHTATILAQFDQVLATNQAALTQGQRLDEALLLQRRRDVMTREWTLTPGNAAVASAHIRVATKDEPFVNSLGMKFVPVPGTNVLFSIYETRVRDYREYARNKTVDASWATQQKDGVPVGRGPEEPVCSVSWDDANGFCRWLTEKEIAEHRVPNGMRYRLPTDEEWSRAVGLPPEVGSTPAEKSNQSRVYPWGEQWPPPPKSGNINDETYHAAFPSGGWVEGYSDGYATTAPVGSFTPNRFGIYDLSGNVWEWCEDWFDATQKTRVLRGGAWEAYGGGGGLWSSHRNPHPPAGRHNPHGFRSVLAFAAPSATPATASNSAEPARAVVPSPKATPLSLPVPGATFAPATPTSRPASVATTRPDAALAKATKDAPFVNSLGMKFVPVPGTKVLFCIHETRRQDYAAYDRETSGVDRAWKDASYNGVPCGREDNHPVVRVSWDDAQAFCTWLSNKEGRTYRLPSDQEWSYAVGIGHIEKRPKGTTPQLLDGKVRNEYPWGSKWPPPKGAGNYADSAFHDTFPLDRFLAGYADGFATTAPVMSFKPNNLGIYDLGGNVMEWLGDWFNAEQNGRVKRGACFSFNGLLESSKRFSRPPNFREPDNGFRCAVELPEP